MVWALIDDGILDNPKIAKVGLFGFAIHVAGIVWSCRTLSDGFIPTARVECLLDVRATSRELLANVDEQMIGINEQVQTDVRELISDRTHPSALFIVQALVDVGLWDEVEGGYMIHDFLVYNPSRAEVLGKKERDAARIALKRAAKSSKGTAGESSATSRATHSRLTGDVASDSLASRASPDPLLNLPSGSPSQISEIQRVTGGSTEDTPEEPSGVRVVPANASGDGAFGALVDSWAGGVRSSGYPNFQAPYGKAAGALATLLRENAPTCPKAHELGVSYAQAHAGQVLSHFRFIDWFGSWSGGTPEGKPGVRGRPVALVQPPAPEGERAWKVGGGNT